MYDEHIEHGCKRECGLIQFTHHIHIRTVIVHASTRFDKFKHDPIKRSL